MSDVPEEILANILSRLPPATLLKFRCVSTRWRDLIDSHSFIEMHLNRSEQTHSWSQVIFYKRNPFRSVSFDALHNLEKRSIESKAFTPPEAIDGPSVRVFSCCNGLVLLSDTMADYVLWNPSTRKHHRSPKLNLNVEHIPGRWDYLYHGFGFDSVNHDYKVFTVYRCDHRPPYNVAMVYSLKLNSWKRVHDFPYNIRWPTCVRAHDALHWVTLLPGRGDKDAIVAFDCVTEKSNLLLKPEQLNHEPGSFFVKLCFLRGCIGLTACFTRDLDEKGWCRIPHRFDVWLMMDYGVGESWSKTFSVAVTYEFFPRYSCELLTFSRDEKQVLLVQDGKELVWYDIEKKTPRKARIRYWPICSGIDICIGSLVRFDSK